MRVKYDIAQNVNSIAICCGFFKKLRKKSRVFRFFIMLSMSCFVALLTVASCSRCSKSKELLDDNNKTEPIDIPIAINVGHTEDPEMKQLVDAEYEITHENDNNLYIDINSDYYKKYLSRERFNASRLAFFENSENVEYLTLNLDIVNNTDQNLSINEMYIDVDKSEIDTVPVIYICTTDNYSNCIHFVNQSWFDWKGFTFSYSILEKGESFDGHYKKSKHIDYFDKILIMDLLPDLIDMGYNFEGLKSSIRNRDAKAFVEGEYGRFLYFYIT